MSVCLTLANLVLSTTPKSGVGLVLLSVAVALGCVIGAILRVVLPVYLMSRKLAHLPGPPRFNWLSGQGQYFQKVVRRSGTYSTMFDVWLDWSKTYGPIFAYRHFHRHLVPVICGADSIKRVLHNVNNTRFVFKDSLKFYNGTRMLGYNGMLLSPYNDSWRIKKSILKQFINHRAVTEFESDMVYVIERALSNHGHSVAGSINTMATPPGALDIDVLPFMQAVTSDILGICLFSKDFQCSSGVESECSNFAQMCVQIAMECFKMMADPSRKLPMKKRKEKLQTVKNIQKIRSITRSMIEKGSPLTDEFVKAFQNIEDIVDDINSLLFAGQDTTSNILAYALANIAHSPEIYNWLLSELNEEEKDAPWSRISQLERLECVIKETLRLYPSAPVSLRTLATDHQLAGLKIPAGSTVWVSPYTAGRHPSVWEEPLSFKPTRFEKLSEETKKQFIPFMTGPHECSGKHLAMMELKMVLFYLLKRYKLVLLNENVPPPKMAITLHPMTPITLRLISVGGPT